MKSLDRALMGEGQIYEAMRHHQPLDGKMPAERLGEHLPELAPARPTVSYVLN